ncbi:MAG: glycosyltransferase family 9 protein [Planctomycetota bacterium]
MSRAHRNDEPADDPNAARVSLPAGAPLAARAAEVCRRAVNAALAAIERVLLRRGRGEPRRVGVWRVGMIGDTLVALPALRAIRRAHPDAEIVLFTSPGPEGAPGALELLEHSPLVDRIVRWTSDDLERRGARGTLAALRRERTDRLYLLPQDRTTPRAEFRLLLALLLAGFRDVRGARVTTAHFLPERLARAHDRAARWPAISTRLLENAERCGVPPLPRDRDGASDLAPTEAERARAADLVRHAAPDGEPLLALAPGAKLAHKRWPAARFGDVARRWIDAGGRVVVLGGPGDAELARAIARVAQRDVTDLCGATSLLGSAALLERVDALVSNDTGTMHLGAAVGAPLVAVFSGWDRRGAWDPVVHDPRRPPIVLRRPAPCSPCVAPSCTNEHGGVPYCLDLAADAVLAAALSVAKRVPADLRDDAELRRAA